MLNLVEIGWEIRRSRGKVQVSLVQTILKLNGI